MGLASSEVRVPVLERPPTWGRTRQSHKPPVSVQGSHPLKMPTACPWEPHVRRYPDGPAQPIPRLAGGGFAAACQAGIGYSGPRIL